MDTQSSAGTCLCGSVTINVDDLPSHVDVCHCRMCRQWSGSPLICLDPVKAITVQGEESVAIYESSEWAVRAFCKHCGTHLYYRLKGQPHFSLPAGLFQDDKGFEMTAQIFVDEKPDYYAFANDCKQLTGAEVLAMFNAEED